MAVLKIGRNKIDKIDIINVDGKYTVAIGVAIGQLINNIITPSAGNAKYLIDFFKKNGGRATFMPLDIILPRKNSDEIKQAIDKYYEEFGAK